jgi:hypothetical protein
MTGSSRWSSWRLLLWDLFDGFAHFLYCPTLGRSAAQARWHHHIHLIPGVALAWVCNRYDRFLGV